MQGQTHKPIFLVIAVVTSSLTVPDDWPKVLDQMLMCSPTWAVAEIVGKKNIIIWLELKDRLHRSNLPSFPLQAKHFTYCVQTYSMQVDWEGVPCFISAHCYEYNAIQPVLPVPGWCFIKTFLSHTQKVIHPRLWSDFPVQKDKIQSR